MLFKTTDELVGYLPVDVNFNFSRIQPLVKSVELQFIKDILGTAEYTALETAYQNETTTADQDALLAYCQEAIAFLAFEKYIPIGNVNISDSGIHIKSNENVKQAFNWQVDDVRRALEEEGYNKLESLLQFLWDNDGTYTDWAASDNAAQYRAHYINSAAEFTNYVDIRNSFRTFWIIRPSLQKIEDFQIKEILERWETGKHAFMLGEIAAGEALTGNDLTIYNLLKPALAHLAIAHAVQVQGLEISSFGVVQKSVEGLEQLHTRKPGKSQDVMSYAQRALADGNAYLQKLNDQVDTLLGVTDDEDDTTDAYNDTDRGVYGFL